MLPTFWPWKSSVFRPRTSKMSWVSPKSMTADLGVGRLALVVVAEPAAEAEHGLGEGRAAGRRARSRDQPAGDVHLVDALVADVAVAEVPEPVPVVMDEVGVIRLLGRRAEPEVEVELLGRSRVGLDADAAARSCSTGRARPAACRACPTGSPRRPGPSRGWSGSGCRAGRSGRTSARPRRRSGPRGRCGCTASRRRRPCPPGRPRSSSGSASGWAWRPRRRRRFLSSSARRMSCTVVGCAAAVASRSARAASRTCGCRDRPGR